MRKRQTGHEIAYQAFLDWLDEYLLLPTAIGGANATRVTAGLLQFPASDTFWDRVFEVWTLRKIWESFGRLGLRTKNGPKPLYDRARGPILTLERAGEEVLIWFQRQRPAGPARWSYAEGRPLSGIPDVTVTRLGTTTPPLIVDAKYRQMTSPTRSEETYKMLGYAENFGLEPFRGLLVLDSDDEYITRLRGPSDGTLTLLGFGAQAGQGVETALDDTLNDWLITQHQSSPFAQ